MAENPDSNPSLSSTPAMEPEGFACLRETLKNSKCYLEYGSGGSTSYAATVAAVPVIISVDTDRKWSDFVRDQLAGVGSRVYTEYCDIGAVGNWGKPVNSEKIKNYWSYMGAPWRVARDQGLVPDVILIDGRFRVASFLFSLLSAKEDSTILFDDYFDRPYYFVVEKFSKPQRAEGRMAVFTVKKNYCVAEICEAIARYSIEPG